MCHGAPPLQYGEQPPPRRLQPWVAYFWEFRVEPGVAPFEHRVPPEGGVSLVFRSDPGRDSGRDPRPLALVAGPHAEARRVPAAGGDQVWGLRFWPGVVRAVLPVDPSHLRDASMPLARVDPGWAERIETALAGCRDLGAVVAACVPLLLDRLPPRRPVDPAVALGVFRILHSRGAEPIAAVAAAAGLSPRQFRRRFRREVGLSPKELARIRRFRATIVEAVLADSARWGELAAGHGYADQAHLTREFRQMIGLTPEAFRKHFSRIRHGRLHA